MENIEKELATKELPPCFFPALFFVLLIVVNWIMLSFERTEDWTFNFYALNAMLIVLEVFALYKGYAEKIYFTTQGLEYYFFGRLRKTVQWGDLHQALVLLGMKGAKYLILVPKECPKFDYYEKGLSSSQVLYVQSHFASLIILDVTDENIANTRRYFQDFDYKAPLTRYNGSNY